MTFYVLVIDDQLATRGSSYIELARRVSALKPDINVQMEFVTNPEDLHTKINARYYSAALVDVILEKNWGEQFRLQSILPQLGEEIPIALVSSGWDNTNADDINMAWQKPNCRMFLHWRDIEEGGSGNIRYAVAQLIKLVALRENIQIHLGLQPNAPIQILHISDLQMGGFDDRRIRLEAQQIADEVLEHCNGTPTFIAFTGDVAERGLPQEYDKARRWLEHFCQKLDFPALPTSRLLLVPGNHDVMLGLGAAGRASLQSSPLGIGLEAKSPLHPDLTAFAYRPYMDFVSDVTQCPWLERARDDQNLAWVEARYRHLGVVFFGLNTAGPANADGLPSRTVSADALDRIKTSLNRVADCSAANSPVVIGLGHHCPLSSSEEGITNPADFATFLKAKGKVKTAAFLHGHGHEYEVIFVAEKGYRLVRGMASTLAKAGHARKEDTLRGFNLLELVRQDGVVSGLTTRSFAWISNSLQHLQTDSFVRHKDGMFQKNV